MHYIQRYILDSLVKADILRNRDMRPEKVESNLYQYHLLQLQKQGYIQKVEQGYTLSNRGLAYADRHSTSLKKSRTQPKIVLILVVENELGEILLVPRQKQPFIGLLNLPSGKLHLDEAVADAVKREYREKVDADDTGVSVAYKSTIHSIISDGEIVISEFIGLIYSCKVVKDVIKKDDFVWFGVANAYPVNIMPGVAEIINAYTDDQLFTETKIDTSLR